MTDVLLIAVIAGGLSLIGFVLGLPSAILGPLHSAQKYRAQDVPDAFAPRDRPDAGLAVVESDQQVPSIYAESALFDAREALSNAMRAGSGEGRDAVAPGPRSAEREAARPVPADHAVDMAGHVVRMALDASALYLREKTMRLSAAIGQDEAADRSAAAQTLAMQSQLADATARASALDRDLAASREQLAAVARQRVDDEAAAEQRAKQGAAARIAELTARLTAARSHADDLDRDLAAARDGAVSLRDDATHRARDGLARLSEAKRTADAALAVAAQRLHDEQAHAASLDQDLVAARDESANMARQRDADRQAARDREVSLQDDATRRVRDGLARLAEAKRTADAELAAAAQRLHDEQARAASLDQDLGAAREQLARAAQDKTIQDRAARDIVDTSQARQTQSAAQIADLTARLATAEASSSDLTRMLADLRQQGAHAPLPSPPDSQGAAKAVADAPSAPSQGAALTVDASRWLHPLASLPAAFPARIVLRYAESSKSARRRAAALKLALQSRGLLVGALVPARKGASVRSVTYFYSEDRESAASIANAASAAGPVRKRLRDGDPLPLPGTVEVNIGG